MGTLCVVVAPEPVELALELLERPRGAPPAEPLLEALVEPLHLAAGLGVVGGGVPVGHPEPVELDLDGAASASSGGRREHRRVVGEDGRGEPVRGKALVEARDHIGRSRRRADV